jgi:hypothetical protein
MAVYVFFRSIPESVRFSSIAAIYDVLRADMLHLGFYSGALLATILLIFRPSNLTLVSGTLCCWIPPLMTYAWTITQERYFGDLLAVVAVPTIYLSFDPWVDILGV